MFPLEIAYLQIAKRMVIIVMSNVTTVNIEVAT